MNRRAIIFGVIGSILMILAWYFLLWSPRQAEITAAEERTAAAESQAASLEQEIQRLQAAQRDEPLKQARRAELQAAAPDEPAIGQFILDANAAASASGIDFMTISQTPPAPGAAGGLSTISLNFSVAGGYFQVLDFMNRLTDLPRLVVLDTVSLSPGQGGGRLSASLGGRIFTTAAGIDPPPTTTTVPPATTTTAPPTPVPTAPPEPQ